MTSSKPGLARADDPVGELYQAHALTLTRFALLLVGDKATAEDVVQDAFLGLYRNWATVRDRAALFGYLRTAVLNGSHSVLRGRARRFRQAGYDPPAWSAEAAVLDREDRREVLTATARLTRRQREVLALRFFLDLTDEEIARTLRVSRGTVSSTISRALRALARELGEGQ